MSQCECEATISQSDPRYDIWMKVVPEGRIPLKHPIAQKAEAGGESGIFYEGDPSRLTEDQKKTLADECSRKFRINASAIIEDLNKGILPIKGDNVIITICNLHVRCMI